MRCKSLFSLVLALLLILPICACSSTAPQDKAKINAASDQSQFTWQIKILSTVTAAALHTKAGIMQYDGSVKDEDYDDSPSNGCEFLIVTLDINKAQVGGKKFFWENLCVKDGPGNEYHRMEDDMFLSKHEYSRLMGTDLSIGDLQGSICFEVPAGTAVSDYILVYDAGDEGQNTIPLS